MTAYLERGDSIHIILPSTGDAERDAREADDMRASYARFGVDVVIVTTAGRFKGDQPLDLPEARVVAVFRTPGPTAEATR